MSGSRSRDVEGFPDTVKIVAERTDISKTAKKAMFEDNPRRLYKL